MKVPPIHLLVLLLDASKVDVTSADNNANQVAVLGSKTTYALVEPLGKVGRSVFGTFNW